MSDNVRQRFGRNVQLTRRRLGLSQEELAARCGLHRTYIGGIERGERNPSLINIERIAKALSVPASKLLDSHNEA